MYISLYIYISMYICTYTVIMLRHLLGCDLHRAIAFSLIFLSLIMPVVERLDWIYRQVCARKVIHVSLGNARNANNLKVKIIIEKGPLGFLLSL